MKLKITVYVRSQRVQTSETLVEELYSVKRATGSYESFKATWFKPKLKKIYSYVLSDDQKTLIEVIKQRCEQDAFEFKVVDVTKENVFYRLWRRLNGFRSFPVVETSRGGRLQAPFSQGELERFILELTPPTE